MITVAKNWAEKLPIFHTHHTCSKSKHPKVTKNPYNSYSEEVSQNFKTNMLQIDLK